METRSFSNTWSANWQGLNLRFPERKIRQRFEKQEFESLKTAYVEKYGYTIAIPQWDDIIRWKPTLLQTDSERKAFKKRALERMLASPAPEFARNYSTVMTWIDNIQDTSSIIFPMFRMLVRWAPKILARTIPYVGWALLGYDLLQLANTLGRAPFALMRAKRAACESLRNNPFSKKAQYARMERIGKWNPRFSDLLQVLQVTADTTGVGLSLGGVVGFVQDLAYGAYRKITGERVTISHELPTMNFYEINSAAAMKAAAFINSAKETFEEEVHFWSLATWAASVSIVTPWIEQGDVGGVSEDLTEAIIDAPEPQDPLTRAVIEEAGLSISAGVGWPANERKKIKLLELSDYMIDQGKEGTKDFFLRHSKDSYGFIAAHLFDQAQEDLYDAVEPTAEYVADDTPIMHVFFQMLKKPVIPLQPTSPTQWQAFEDWVNFYTEQNEAYPKMTLIVDKLDQLQIPYTKTFPAEMDPSVKNFFPDPFDDSEYA